MIDQTRIRALIRHAERMCLLQRVLSWDNATIICQTSSHCDPQNPLRRDGVLRAVHLIEYCAQAMAVHRGLVSEANGERAPPGVLVSARAFTFQVERLDDIPGPLTVKARELLYFEGGTQYEVAAEADGRLLGGGRISVVRMPQ
jgi:predicted hotdog family 3-hydroxylacyl-ACP dehydratase